MNKPSLPALPFSPIWIGAALLVYGGALLIRSQESIPSSAAPAVENPAAATATHPASLVPEAIGPAPETDAETALSGELLPDEDDINAQEAIEQLHAPDTWERAQAAMQLAANQTPKAAKELAHALSEDPAAEVRVAAAETLAIFYRPPQQAWDALLNGLEDISPEVQVAAADTVQTLLFKYDEDSKTAGRIRDALKITLRSSKLTDAARESLQGLMDQLEPS